MAISITKVANSKKSGAARRAIGLVNQVSKLAGQNRAANFTTGQDLNLFALRPASVAESISRNQDNGQVAKNTNANDPAQLEAEDESENSGAKYVASNRFAQRVWGSMANARLNGIPSSGGGTGGAGAAGAVAISSGGISGGAYGGAGAGLGGGGGSSKSSSGGGSSKSKTGGYGDDDSNIRQFNDKDGGSHNIDRGRGITDDGLRKEYDKNGNLDRFSSGGGKNPYENIQNTLPQGKHADTTKGQGLENLKAKMSPEDKKLYDKLAGITNVYRNDSVGFDTRLDSADKSREASPELRDQTLAFLVDTLKKESSEVQNNVLNNGDINIFLSDKLSFGMNKSVGGFVGTSKGQGSDMALPLDLSDFSHTDIARHEGNHLKDVASDGVLDGLVSGEDKEVQDLMLSAMRKFNAGQYEESKIAELDVGNLRYGSGYTAKLDREGKGKAVNPGDQYGINESFALAEARAVLEQEFADKPEAFRAAGEEFAQLADHWQDTTVDYKDSYLQKDGHADKTGMS